MILAEDEVGLGADHAGIMLLDEASSPGTPLADVLPLVDDVLDVESTGNRARPALGLRRSRARSRRSTTSRSRRRRGRDPEPVPRRERVEIAIDDLEGCPRYIGRLFAGVRVGAVAAVAAARLSAAGMRPISNVVDITNYVMLALGNPLHAFDCTTLAGGRIVVRRARRRREAAHARRRRTASSSRPTS